MDTLVTYFGTLLKPLISEDIKGWFNGDITVSQRVIFKEQTINQLFIFKIIFLGYSCAACSFNIFALVPKWYCS